MAESNNPTDINFVITGKEVMDGGCVGVQVTLLGGSVDKLKTNELPHLLHGLGLTDYAKDTGRRKGFPYIFPLVFD